MADTALPSLIEAKGHSDAKNYRMKHRVLTLMMQKNPEAFHVDSDDGKGIVGITHIPTGFRLHIPKQILQPGVQKAAGWKTSLAAKLQGGLSKVPKELGSGWLPYVTHGMGTAASGAFKGMRGMSNARRGILPALATGGTALGADYAADGEVNHGFLDAGAAFSAALLLARVMRSI